MAVPRSLLDIPHDIIVTLPDYLHDIEDYKNLSSTCRTLRVYLAATSPKTLLRLTVAASSTFFRPSPHFLVAGVARQLGDWARLSPSNEDVLARTFRGGVDAVLALCLEHCGLTMEGVRDLHAMTFSVVNPVTDIIDKCVGEQWYATPNFWDGGVDDAYTIDVDPPETLFHLAIYGEFFGPDLDIILDRQPDGKHALGVETRLEYVKYCIPDWACYSCQNGACDVELPDGSIDPRRLVLGTGPYEDYGRHNVNVVLHGSQIGLNHLLESSRWNPRWDTVRKRISPDFAQPVDYMAVSIDTVELDGWQQLLWQNIAQLQGLGGLAMISGGAAEWKNRLMELWGKIATLEGPPGIVKVGGNVTFNWPYLTGDLKICSSGYVVGT
jgi:hypothetical protein